jgi:hypothetical protein
MLLRLRVLQLLALSAFLIGLAAIAMAARTTVLDPDIWWHLKTGDWIVQHHAVPFNGIFSGTAANRPWIAYSWGYEVMLSRAYAWFGLMGFAWFGVILTMLDGFVLFWMLHRLCGRFWVAWLLSVLGGYAYLFSLNPRPVFVTMIFFSILLTLLVEAQRSATLSPLYWLPLLFVLWANIHIQFIYGLATLGLFMGVSLGTRWIRKLGCKVDFVTSPTLESRGLVAIFAACVAACFVGPYSYHLIQVITTYSGSQVPYLIIQELEALDFKSTTEYAILALTAAAFFVLGREKKLDIFRLGLLMVSSYVAFRTQRDAWFVSITAAVFLADYFRSGEVKRPVLRIPEAAILVACVGLISVLVADNSRFTLRDLDAAISKQYPVDAANFLRKNPFPGPLYNHLEWGGFLIWYMPQYPVTVDGRNDLYGDELDMVTYKSVSGESYKTDPYLKRANVVLLSRTLPLADLLLIDSDYRVVYRDNVAVVFVRN